MLDGDHYLTHQLVDQLMSNAQMKHTFDLIESLKPDLNIVNGKYQYAYQGIIFADGDTVHLAMMEFQRKFYTQKP